MSERLGALKFSSPETWELLRLYFQDYPAYCRRIGRSTEFRVWGTPRDRHPPYTLPEPLTEVQIAELESDNE